MTTSNALFWKEDWDECRENLIKWWNRQGLAFAVTAPADKPWADLPKPDDQTDPEQHWMNPVYRARNGAYKLSRTFHGGEAYPYLDTNTGPGNLANCLGSQPGFTFGTVWYHPCINDPDTYPPIVFDPGNVWFHRQMAIIEEAVRMTEGRFIVGMPDLIENIDILAAMRDPQTLMMDMIERPNLVSKRVDEINTAYFEVFDRYHAKILTPWGGNAFAAFGIWGPGKTAKVQCDASAMFSPDMFARFVVPALTRQCQWLDYSMYHLDGPQCICHVDHLLSIEPLNAIQWTPGAANPTGGDPCWHPMYKRILAGGKGVQIYSKASDVLPLLDTIGSRGVFVKTNVKTEAEARELLSSINVRHRHR